MRAKAGGHEDGQVTPHRLAQGWHFTLRAEGRTLGFKVHELRLREKVVQRVGIEKRQQDWEIF